MSVRVCGDSTLRSVWPAEQPGLLLSPSRSNFKALWAHAVVGVHVHKHAEICMALTAADTSCHLRRLQVMQLRCSQHLEWHPKPCPPFRVANPSLLYPGAPQACAAQLTCRPSSPMASPTADRLMTWFSSFFQASNVSAGQPQLLAQLQQVWMCRCCDPLSLPSIQWQWLAVCGAAQTSVAHQAAVAGSVCVQGSNATRWPLLPTGSPS